MVIPLCVSTWHESEGVDEMDVYSHSTSAIACHKLFACLIAVGKAMRLQAALPKPERFHSETETHCSITLHVGITG